MQVGHTRTASPLGNLQELSGLVDSFRTAKILYAKDEKIEGLGEMCLMSKVSKVSLRCTLGATDVLPPNSVLMASFSIQCSIFTRLVCRGALITNRLQASCVCVCPCLVQYG